ncbi:hypothetical protein [Thermostaphylospora chromogena]|uniref:Integral membrane protein n=1 Tax=Thermostaphylospora chromogena TaxID=35622 RepID=A0A1H1I4S8_9ACTN|nr:hypothetical protein [Thermostaphylospora chromogena]SDR32642.1 hypothetical protein SAMN04489764_5191 [Thermostaphylospora chromogena]
MNQAVATAVIAGSLVLAVASLIGAVRNRAMGMVLLIGFCVLEVALIVQTVLVVVAHVGGEGPADAVTLYGYLIGSLLVPPAGVLLALAERSRWGTAVLILAGFAVAVMTGRLLQVWQGVT